MKSQPVIGATAMVYDFDMAYNLRQLAPHVRHAELLLYWTPTENNFPAPAKVCELHNLAQDLDMSLSVHLPPMLDLVTASAANCLKHLDLLCNLINNMEMLQTSSYVLHLGPHAPTLSADPNAYLYADSGQDLSYWYDRGTQALTELQKATGLGLRLLVENLNFSPLLLQPFLATGLAGLCFDAGHAWLGNEALTEAFTSLSGYVREMHLHGVSDGMEHLSLSSLTPGRLEALKVLISQRQYTNLINLEVFSPKDLTTSLECLADI